MVDLDATEFLDLVCPLVNNWQAREIRTGAEARRGLYEQAPRLDMQRLYYASNMLFIDESEAGMSRAACVKALQAEGVRAHASSYLLQHKCPLYQDPQWWHHLPTLPELPGSEQANKTAIALPYFTSQMPEVMDQYVKAFEKVWAKRSDLAK